MQSSTEILALVVLLTVSMNSLISVIIKIKVISFFFLSPLI